MPTYYIAQKDGFNYSLSEALNSKREIEKKLKSGEIWSYETKILQEINLSGDNKESELSKISKIIESDDIPTVNAMLFNGSILLGTYQKIIEENGVLTQKMFYCMGIINEVNLSKKPI